MLAGVLQLPGYLTQNWRLLSIRDPQNTILGVQLLFRSSSVLMLLPVLHSTKLAAYSTTITRYFEAGPQASQQ
jgi:hypothetical protein